MIHQKIQYYQNWIPSNPWMSASEGASSLPYVTVGTFALIPVPFLGGLFDAHAWTPCSWNIEFREIQLIVKSKGNYAMHRTALTISNTNFQGKLSVLRYWPWNSTSFHNSSIKFPSLDLHPCHIWSSLGPNALQLWWVSLGYSFLLVFQVSIFRLCPTGVTSSF